MDTLPKIKRLSLLFQGSRLQNVPKGYVFQTSEDTSHINIIVSGFAKRYFIAHNGSLGVQAIYGQGDVFPLTVVFETLFSQKLYQGPETYYYESITPTRLFTINATTLQLRIQADFSLYRDLLQNVGIRLHSNIQFLENLRLHGAYSKTAHQLAYLGLRFGEETRLGIKIKLPLTHQDLADSIGTTRETVTASIIKLRDKKLIKTDRNILILDMERLTAEAYS